MTNGIVYFVGAGPGDPELLTIKGKRALQSADVVIFDRLVNPILLTEIKDGAKLIYCGKQPCQHFLRQEDIQKELLIHARKGKKVVRLKGGDPAVFGRVGEEAELLSENDIKYEIIPGITSGIAAPMYAGATVTHREHSRSFAIVSGHGKDGKPKADWQSLAKGVDTIIFYMGVKYLRMITEQLIKAGKDKKTSVLIIQWGTFSKQRTVEGTLATIANQVEQEGITNPAIIVVGNVVKLRKKLQWFDNRQLSGKAILFPTKSQNNEFVEQLRRDGADVYQHPILRSRTLINEEAFQGKVKEIHKFTKIIFLSSEGVRTFIKGLVQNGLDLRMIQAEFYTEIDEVRETLHSFGCLAHSGCKFNKLDYVMVVGGRDEVNDYIRLAESFQTLITHEEEVSNSEVEAFTRLIEEEHVNTLLLTNRSEAMSFLKVFEKSELTPQTILKRLQIICRGKEVALMLRAYHLQAQILMDADVSDETVIEHLTIKDRLSFAIDS